MTDNCPSCLQGQVRPIAEHRDDAQISHLYRCPRCGATWSTNRDWQAYGEAA